MSISLGGLINLLISKGHDLVLIHGNRLFFLSECVFGHNSLSFCYNPVGKILSIDVELMFVLLLAISAISFTL